MSTVSYAIQGGLSDQQIQKIHDAALRVLDEIGMEIRTDVMSLADIKKLLGDVDGIRFDGSRIYFSPDLMERYIGQCRDWLARLRAERTPSDEILIRTPAHAFHYIEPVEGKTIPADTAAITEAVRLTDSMRGLGVRGAAPGAPVDVDPALRPLAAYKISCQNTRNTPVAVITDPAMADYLVEMKQIMGYATADSCHVGFHPVSPLRLEGDEFDIALTMFQRFGRNLSVNVGPMPIMGVSAPIFFPGAMTQALAEGLGGFAFFKALTHEGQCSFWANFYAFDMKFGNFVYGCPEEMLVSLMRNQVSQWYGADNVAGQKAFSSMAHEPDAHAAAEKSAKVVTALLAGATDLHNAGVLSLDETFSPEQLIIDVEITNWAKRLLAGYDFTDESLSVELIRDVIDNHGGDFLSHDSTLSHYRETYWTGELFEYLMHNQWTARGAKTVRQRAREMIKKQLTTWDFQLDADKHRALETVYARAQKALST